MKNSTKKALAFAIAVGAAFALSGCGQAPWENSMKDLEGVQFLAPDEAIAWNNIDKHPNIVRLCLDGVAVMTTTREYGDAVTRVPEWDAHCKSVMDAK